jgi:hypothetical protein
VGNTRLMAWAMERPDERPNCIGQVG